MSQVPWICDLPFLSSHTAIDALNCCIEFCSSTKLWVTRPPITALHALPFNCYVRRRRASWQLEPSPFCVSGASFVLRCLKTIALLHQPSLQTSNGSSARQHSCSDQTNQLNASRPPNSFTRSAFFAHVCVLFPGSRTQCTKFARRRLLL